MYERNKLYAEFKMYWNGINCFILLCLSIVKWNNWLEDVNTMCIKNLYNSINNYADKNIQRTQSCRRLKNYRWINKRINTHNHFIYQVVTYTDIAKTTNQINKWQKCWKAHTTNSYFNKNAWYKFNICSIKNLYLILNSLQTVFIAFF